MTNTTNKAENKKGAWGWPIANVYMDHDGCVTDGLRKKEQQ